MTVASGRAFLVSLGCGAALALPVLATPAPAGASIPAASLVVHPAEMPGFTTARVKLQSAKSPSRFAKVVLGEHSREARSEIKRLKRKGFRGGAQEFLSTLAGEALSLALVFANARVAEHELAISMSEDLKAQGKAAVARFTVPAIPGSAGFSAVEAGAPSAAANVLFTSGRCFFVVGDSLAKATPEQADSAPIAGATALYVRVKGLCS
jgi:hypothetical protein